jgi:hypothetical protein
MTFLRNRSSTTVSLIGYKALKSSSGDGSYIKECSFATSTWFIGTHLISPLSN